MRSCAGRWRGSTTPDSDAPAGAAGGCSWARCTGFSPAQITRLVRQQMATGVVEDRRARNRGRSFEAVYTAADIRLLDGRYSEITKGQIGAL